MTSTQIKTEGIKYAGSKRLLIPEILKVIEPLGVDTVLDGFSGTTRVSQALKQAGYTVYANDVAVWSRVFAECYLLNQQPKNHYQPMIDHLNSLPGNHGWFSENYGGIVKKNAKSSVQADGKKRIWQMHNTMKLDAIRNELDQMSLSDIEKSVLLTSLIHAMDKVDSSVGHHTSYLREWAARAYTPMQMEVPKLLLDDKEHYVFQQDIFDLLAQTKNSDTGNATPDLVYYDPPYGSSNDLMPASRVRYASYYHLWKTICLNDRPEITGAANRRKDVSDKLAASEFEEFRTDADDVFLAVKTLKRLLQNTPSRYILLSYNNNGRATFSAIMHLIKELGLDCAITEIDHRRHVMTTMTWTDEWVQNQATRQTKNIEYLFLLNRSE